MRCSAYDFLDLDPGFSAEELKQAYWRKARLYHPDGGVFHNEEVFQNLRRAYELLLNEHTRETVGHRRIFSLEMLVPPRVCDETTQLVLENLLAVERLQK